MFIAELFPGSYLLTLCDSFLLFQVCRMASDYSRTCVSPDSIQTGEAPVVSETCEVYVWGSNSSHQLVEGTQEKILQPKLAASFADAQTVRELRPLSAVQLCAP